MLDFIKRVFGTSHERMMRKLRPVVVQINALEPTIKALSDDELRAQTPKFKEMLDNGASLDDLMPEAFATVREASRRVLNMRHYDVQLIGGIVLHRGMISEMKTGEGKTLVATSPMYLNALEGKGAHLVTVNDYLASRDADWMGQIYKFLGLTVGKILADLDNEQRRASYNCDITYGTNNEFGFDYLRDNMKYQLSDYVQRGHHYAIVDEVDSILIDEARTPLIISGQLEQDLNLYKEINRLVPFLKRDEDYTVDEKAHGVALNETGIEKLEKHLKIENIYDPKYIEYLHHVNKALEAHTLYKLDQNYVIENGKIVIIDDFTGRMMYGRRWSDGLHQAIEAKEGVEIQAESQTLATITFQNYFRMYKKLAGMTGTADTEAEEFKKIYKLDVVSVPTAKKIIRKDYQDVIYFNEKVKIQAIAEQIEQCHAKGQPILVGTVSVEKSEVFSRAIDRLGIKHNVLNAKNHKREAEIIAQAGRKGAVTIATNMAGRGTDILLGGNPEFLARQACNGNADDPRYPEMLEKFKAECAAEKVEVQEAGGLFILGTERHESRRIDNQLRGRAGRQGDPGASRFFLSLDDDLLRIFGGEELKNRMAMFGMDKQADIPIESRLVSRSIETAQKRVEGRNFDIRKNLLEYDDVMNAQRKAVYGLRNDILKGENLEDTVLNGFEDIVFKNADEFLPEGVAFEDWNMPEMLKALERIMGTPVHADFSSVGRGDRSAQLELIWGEIEKVYNRQVEQFDNLVSAFESKLGDDSPYKGKTGKDLLMELAQNYYLREIDHFWRAHLTTMTGLRESISLRGYAQKDPKQEYKREAYSLFEKMMYNIKMRVMSQLCRLEVEQPDFSRMRSVERRPSNSQAGKKHELSDKASHSEQVEELRRTAASAAPRKSMSMADLMPPSIAAAAKRQEAPKKSLSMVDLMPASMRQAMEDAAAAQRRLAMRMQEEEEERLAAEASAQSQTEAEAGHDSVESESASVVEASSEDATEEKASSEDATEEKASSQDATEEKASSEDATEEKVSSQDATEEKAPSQDATEEKVSSQDATEEKAPSEDATEGKVSSEDATEEKASSEDATDDKVEGGSNGKGDGAAQVDTSADHGVAKTEQEKPKFSMLDDLFGASGGELGDLDDGVVGGKSEADNGGIRLGDDLFSTIANASSSDFGGLSGSKSLSDLDDSDDPFGIFAKLKDETK